MSELNERPIIFSLSNPTSKSECTAEQAYTWSKGRAIFASGSPFDPVTLDGVTHVPGQGNNAYVFPGLGLGAIACESSRVTDEMFFEAAKTLAGLVTEEDLALGRVYPALTRIREVSAAIAATVVRIAYERDLALRPEPKDIEEHIKSLMYFPEYGSYV
jgi:malate dehydrogenase (oxaloacetate-decarboxylating)(NADP+)